MGASAWAQSTIDTYLRRCYLFSFGRCAAGWAPGEVEVAIEPCTKEGRESRSPESVSAEAESGLTQDA